MSRRDDVARPGGGRARAAMIAAGMVAAVIALLVGWARAGLDFYEHVVPFYDSLSYQEAFRETARLAVQAGRGSALVQVWRQPENTVVLYKLAAVLLTPVGWERAGLYVYLFSIHGAALLTLGAVTWRASRSPALAIGAMAAWLSAEPFFLLRDGVGDQRMDLASASCCLLVTALMLAWSRTPSWRWGLAAGLAAALAVLHRPVMASTFAVIVVLFTARALRAHRRPARAWAADALALAGPGLVIALPWLLAHFETLRHYYLEANVDVGNAPSVGAAAAFNGRRFAETVGWVYGALVLIGVTGLAWRWRLDWLDAAVILAATAVPLATLSLSRSMGNVYVGQLSAGLPALLLACARPGGRREAGWWTAVAAAGFALVAVVSVRALEAEGARTRGSPLRGEAVEVVRAIMAQTSGGRLAAFQDLPMNLVALTAIARDEGAPLTAGLRAYHAPEFGLPNLPLDAITEEQKRQAAAWAVETVARSDDLLLVATPETAPWLYQGMFSHRLMPELRAAALHDPRFERLRPVGPVGGIRFELFRVRH